MSDPVFDPPFLQPPQTVGTAVDALESGFAAASLSYGHGAVCARDEAAWLIFHVANLAHDQADAVWSKALSADELLRIRQLANERIASRKPLAYLINEAWFCGLRFYVDDQVLVPRSPLAELILNGFAPWLADEDLVSALDVGTGSGCIAIALAACYPDAKVHASDLSDTALVVAQRNVRAHSLDDRVSLFKADIFDGLPEGSRYDLIISNPPYVDGPAMRALPTEYRHEPAGALAAGEDGLEIVEKMLEQAAQFLTDRGILVVEVGDSQDALARRFKNMPFTWLEMSDGASGIFLLNKAELSQSLKSI